jgi:hypothetical protein
MPRLVSRLVRIEERMPPPASSRSFGRWIERTCDADPEAREAYIRAMARARELVGHPRPTWGELFEVLETDPVCVEDWRLFVAGGLQLLLDHPEIPLWMLDLEQAGYPSAVEWIGRLRGMGAEVERWL